MITTQCHNSATAGRVPGSDLPGQPQRLAPCVLGSSSRLDTGLGLLLRLGLRRCGVGRAGALGAVFAVCGGETRQTANTAKMRTQRKEH